MRSTYSALALALVAPSVLAQECPPGYEKSKISWVDCPVTDLPSLQCATLEVPLDYAKPSGDILNLRLIRVPASAANPRNKSIIYNPGGPGEPGIANLVGGGFGLDIQKLVGTDFNLIGFDPRGTGLSIPFGCPLLDRPNDYKEPDSVLRRLYNALSRQSDECAKFREQNALIGTAYVARDIKAIAEALGEDGLIRYLGYSYGTLLGATTAAMFPESIDRMVLDGNINPTDYYYGLGEESVAAFDPSVSRFFDLCAEAGPDNCAIAVDGQTGAQLKQTYDDFLSSITYEQSYDIRGEFFGSLYAPSDFAAQAEALEGYYNNSTGSERRSLRRRQSEEDEEEEDDENSAGFDPTLSEAANTPMALEGITCGDWIITPEASVDAFKEYLAIWKRNDAREKYMGGFRGIATKTPILFVNTQFDPVTPLVSAQNSSSGFIGSRLLVSTASGHCSTRQPSSELDAQIRQYFVDASFPTVQKIYNPDQANPFVEPPADVPTGPNPTRRKRRTTYPAFFDDKNAMVKRQTKVPVGCVKKHTSSSSRSSSSHKATSSASVSASKIYSTSSAHTVSSSGKASASASSTGLKGYASTSTRSAGYGDYYSRSTRVVANGYNGGGYEDSPRTSTRTPSYDGYGSPSVSTRIPSYDGYGHASSSTRTPSYGGHGYASSSVRSPVYDGYGYASSSARVPSYDGYGHPTSSPSPKHPSTVTTPAGSHPSIPCVTKTITDFTYETVTKCSGYNDHCQVGSVVTKTSIRTTVVTVTASATPIVHKSIVSSAPGQVYSVPPKSDQPYVSKPAQLSAPAVSHPVYGTPIKVSSAAPVHEPVKSSAAHVVPVSVSKATSVVYSVPTYTVPAEVPKNATRSSGTPTSYYGPQFTGAAATERVVVSFFALVVGITSLAVLL
ncbi:alpha/beta hydrolase fold-domain-containing protein [Paraphoma chrysanthemicola]|uniref:Alpha/beta hydrolase fold-domain-containing protein n=1 Tax=Paraphoma chrysanthemicola TaxID=798071 RepID=A0A8K0RAE6_9PLEO|nr:alpha/beta hydrolase fold-domain-containing protein [Paraphoma chrysanthemicola]